MREAARVEREPTALTSAEAGEGISVRVREVRKRFGPRTGAGGVVALDGVSLEVHRGEFLVMLGPSGCGKTTLLRSLAGLERPEGGEIEIEGQTVFSAARGIHEPPHRRPVSMMFQSYALWPHMTVYENVAFPLRMKRRGGGEERTRVREVLEMVGCGGLERRYPGELSGGQQQRVALARAIVAGDRVILFDEPLSNVDARVREELRGEIVQMQRRLGFTAIYVTHDQKEAMAIADRLVVMEGGRILQVGSPQEVYLQPRSERVAYIVGRGNLLSGQVVGQEGGRYLVETPAGRLMGTGEDRLKPGERVRVFFRPEVCRVVHGAETGWTGAVRGIVRQRAFLGNIQELRVQVGQAEILVEVPEGVEVPGGEVTLEIPEDRVRVFRETAPTHS
ncbi:MAG: ABC transporter ATP-binding protein [Armatimonadota bacterium]|nr:ABC transporter ATP-binding protein [Armatimonadota bacterium]MDR7443580.1 ABC transporter ATP-binding protein [Armatimonadota bacterium]MDR7615551.1 ABC transporter ATP-binding protein [Armatimonadota bacterium]